MGSEDKTVRDGFLSTVVHQISTNDPPETKATYDRLQAAGMSEGQALQLIGLVLKKEMKEMIMESRGFDNERFIALMKKLPDIS
jgi:uncharacterized protein YoaH (UPF0181 family)